MGYSYITLFLIFIGHFAVSHLVHGAGGLFKGYLKLRTLGGGASAVAYEVRRLGGSKFALKKGKHTDVNLRKEYELLKLFENEKGFPKVYDFFTCGDGSDCYVMELVGPVITDIQKNRLGGNRELPIHTVGSIAIQMVDRMETIHRKEFVHGDFYRNNLSPGIGEKSSILYAIDFGQVSKVGLGKKTKVHDLRSLAFSVACMLQKSFRYGDYQHFAEDKNKSNNSSIFKGLPTEMGLLMKYVAKLKAGESIDYGLVRKLMIQMMENAGYKYKQQIIWPREILEKLP